MGRDHRPCSDDAAALSTGAWCEHPRREAQAAARWHPALHMWQLTRIGIVRQSAWRCGPALRLPGVPLDVQRPPYRDRRWAQDEIVTKAVLAALDTQALPVVDAKDTEQTSLLSVIATVDAELEELAAADLPVRVFATRARILDARRSDAETRLSQLQRRSAVRTFDPTTQWEHLTSDQQRVILHEVVDHIEVARSAPGRPFDPARLSIVWRV